MSGYQRMVVIPQNEYIQLTSLQEVKQPLAQQYLKAEQNYEDATAIDDPYTRLAVRSETMDRMKSLKQDMRNYISLATPKPYKTRAERLLSVLEPHLKWTEKGELIDPKTNRPIERSQLSDLILHSVQDRRRNISPTGWKYFVDRLREHNVPQMLLNMPTLEELKKPSKLRPPTSLSSRKRRTEGELLLSATSSGKKPIKRLRKTVQPPKKYTSFLTKY